jgi:hypothetical protein
MNCLLWIDHVTVQDVGWPLPSSQLTAMLIQQRFRLPCVLGQEVAGAEGVSAKNDHKWKVQP